ncbi:hypothetical protein PFISCL1PPCAC_15638, partial [Pristionchus fissidentatus]
QRWRLIVDYVDEVRSRINASCLHLESWQVASYSLSFVFLTLYMLDLASSEKGVIERIRARIFYILRSLPWVRSRLNEDLARAKKELEEEVHSHDHMRDFYKFIPERGLSRDEIRAEAELYRSMGNKRREIAQYDMKTNDIVTEIKSLFGGSNPRDSNFFPGCRKMESEILRMCLSLFHGGSNSTGVVVPSTAESIMMALSSARSLSIRNGIVHPTILASSASAPSLFHSAKLLGMRVQIVPCKKDGSVEAVTLKRFISNYTVLIFVSAPNYSTGTCDPIDSIAKVAQRYHIPLHIDCSLGGFILPFLELCDYHIPSFDFRLPGVSSISIDFSRFSRCPSTCSLTLFRDEHMMKASVFPLAEWPGGIYSTPSLSDSLDGSAIAAAWSTLLSTGKAGFIETTQRVVESTKKLATLLAEINGITLLGSADTVMVAFETTKPSDIYYIVEVMRNKGWPLQSLVSPPAARMTMSLDMAQDAVIDSFLDDLDTVESAKIINGSLSRQQSDLVGPRRSLIFRFSYSNSRVPKAFSSPIIELNFLFLWRSFNGLDEQDIHAGFALALQYRAVPLNFAKNIDFVAVNID